MDRKVLEVSSLSLSFSDYLPTCLSIFMYLSIYRSIYLSLSLFHLITYLPIYLSTYVSNYLSIYLSMYLSFYLSIYLSIYLSLSLSSVYLSSCLSVYVSTWCFTLQVSRICAMAVGTTATKLGSKARQTWVMSWLRGIRRIVAGRPSHARLLVASPGWRMSMGSTARGWGQHFV